MFGTDSHTCNAGAFGQFATGIGNTDAGFIVGTGKLLIKVPPTMRFILDGEMPPYLLAKDLILQIIGEISVAGTTFILLLVMSGPIYSHHGTGSDGSSAQKTFAWISVPVFLYQF